jgi:hypothetical protein
MSVRRDITVVDKSTRGVDDPTSEILATTGLITMLGAVLAAVIAAATLGEGSAAMAGIFGAVALLSFAVSLMCFAVDSNRGAEAPLPFPSWLRTEAETPTELSALP